MAAKEWEISRRPLYGCGFSCLPPETAAAATTAAAAEAAAAAAGAQKGGASCGIF